jgi:phosphoglycerate kinase
MHAFNTWDCCRILLGFCFFFFLFFWGWGIHRPIIMTHVGRPYDKKTKILSVKLEDESIEPVVAYLQRKLRIKFAVPLFHVTDNEGIQDIDTSINWLINDLRACKIGGIYLPNTRWFAGEEGTGEKMERFVVQLAGVADVFVNDAFGSWQPHASTYYITKYLPSYAGLCMQNELIHVQGILNPKQPFLAIVAGAKYDTKIGPLKAMYKKVDKLILGGVVYNTFLCAKYGVKIEGVEDSDIALAKDLVEQDKVEHKIVELPFVVESETLEARIEGKYRTISIKDFTPGKEYSYIVDVDPSSFDEPHVVEAIDLSKTIFVNAVMGLMPHFWHGTYKMDEMIDRNRSAQKFFGGGDTLQEFKSLHPGLYQKALESPKYYLFTGGGTVLKVIEEGDPFALPTVKALIENGKQYGYKPQ